MSARWRSVLDVGALVPIALLAIATIACQGQPIPLSAARGTTVTIPIGSGGYNLGEGVLMGYGTVADPDYQRGRLRLWLDVEPGSDVELTVRGIARVSPDPASRAGLSLGADYEQSGQVVMLVDVPLTAPVGTWYIYAERYQHQWNAGTSTWVEQPLGSAPLYQYALEVLPETGSPTPFEGFALSQVFDVSDEVLDFKPLPKFRFNFSLATVGALNFTVAYPSSRAVVRAVNAEPLGDSTLWAARALISYSEPSAGVLQVNCIVPDGVSFAAFAIVYELTHPTDPPPVGGPLATSDFVISGIQAWDVSGEPVSASAPSGARKIF